MTCIVGLIDRKNNVSWIGGDSLGSTNCTHEVVATPKVFVNETFKNVLMGTTGSFRHSDLLRYSKTLFNDVDMPKTKEFNHKFMVTEFVPKILDLFKNGIVSEEERNRGGHFIVAAPGRLYKIQSDYSVVDPELGVCAIGSGEEVAMGSLITTKDLDMPCQDRIIKALEAAELYSRGVGRPFHILCTDGREEIVIK